MACCFTYGCPEYSVTPVLVPPCYTKCESPALCFPCLPRCEKPEVIYCIPKPPPRRKECCHHEERGSHQDSCCHHKERGSHQDSCCHHKEHGSHQDSCCHHNERGSHQDSCCHHNDHGSRQDSCCHHKEHGSHQDSCCHHNQTERPSDRLASPACCKPVRTKYVIPCYRYEDGRIERYVPTVHGRLPPSAYRRNGMQDQIQGYRGARRYLCCRDTPYGCYVHTIVEPIQRLYPKVTQEMNAVKRKKDKK